jgi:ssDNA thymidine ADP-ribosyltransferase, DarT
MKALIPDKAYIFRITHIDNLPWIIRHGIHCRNSTETDPDFINIGNRELIEKRTYRQVPIAPFGTLADYVPFYFTPHSPMLLNIKTGYNGIVQRNNADIAIFVGSLRSIAESGHDFVFSDRHAYLQTAEFSSSLADLKMIAWHLLQDRNFKRDPEHPDNFEKYQAEALVRGIMPLDLLAGVAVFNDAAREKAERMAKAAGKVVKIVAKPGWYF